MVKINGESLDVAGKTLADYLAQADYDLQRIAVGEAAGAVVFQAPAYAGQKYEKGSPGQAELSTLIYGKDQA